MMLNLSRYFCPYQAIFVTVNVSDFNKSQLSKDILTSYSLRDWDRIVDRILGRIVERKEGEGRRLQRPCSIKDRNLCDNSLFLEAINYYCKGIHLRYNRGPRSSSEKCFSNSIYLTRNKFRKETYKKGIKNNNIFFLLVQWVCCFHAHCKQW